MVALNALGGMACALGGTCLAAAYVTARHPNRARVAAVASSAAMVSWIVAQVATIGYRSPLQPLVAATGLTVAGDMWNSNSVTVWLLARAGNRPATGRRAGGRAGPGMDRGLRSRGLALDTGGRPVAVYVPRHL